MEELIRLNYAEETVKARDVYGIVFDGESKRTAYNVWFSRVAARFGFIEGKDFQSYLIESSGGRRAVGHVCTWDMGKELCMISPTKNGKRARQYFIKCEKIAKQLYMKTQAARLAGIQTRRTLTDEIRDTGENERMHGHGYSTYTRLAYKLTGIPKGDRSKLSPEDLDRLENVESIMKGYLKAGQDYQKIKGALEPLFSMEGSRALKE